MWKWMIRLMCFMAGCLVGIGIAVREYEKENKARKI